MWKTVKEDEEEMKEDPTFWRPETMGESRVGVLNEVDPDAGKFEGSILYVFNGEESNPKDHQEIWKKWGAKQLDGIMKKISIGDRVKITFVQTHPSKKGRPWQEYRVERDEPEGEGETSLQGEPIHPAAIKQKEPEPETQGALFQEAKGYINDAYSTLAGKGNQEPTGEDLKNELLDMYGNHYLTSEYGFSAKAIFNAAMKEVERMGGQNNKER